MFEIIVRCLGMLQMFLLFVTPFFPCWILSVISAFYSLIALSHDCSNFLRN